MSGREDVFSLPEPDGYLTASDVKGVANEVIGSLPLPGIEGSPLDPGDIWAVVILASVNQTSIWDTCSDHKDTPCDDTVLTWLHTLNRGWLEVAANLLFMRLALTILDPDRSRIVSSTSSITPSTARLPRTTANCVR
jgi:hypothetical protein